jgi:hypothetical protein
MSSKLERCKIHNCKKKQREQSLKQESPACGLKLYMSLWSIVKNKLNHLNKVAVQPLKNILLYSNIMEHVAWQLSTSN